MAPSKEHGNHFDQTMILPHLQHQSSSEGDKKFQETVQQDKNKQ
jgi:hypothetical protein